MLSLVLQIPVWPELRSSLHLSQSVNVNCDSWADLSWACYFCAYLLLLECHALPGYQFEAPSLLHKSASSPLALAFSIYVSGDLRLSYRLPWMWLTPSDVFKQLVPQPSPASSGRRRRENAILRFPCRPPSTLIPLPSHAFSIGSMLQWVGAWGGLGGPSPQSGIMIAFCNPGGSP